MEGCRRQCGSQLIGGGGYLRKVLATVSSRCLLER